jgi:hypothetical protein
VASITEVQVFIDDDYKHTLESLLNLRNRICSEDVCSIEVDCGVALVVQIATKVEELCAEIRDLQVYRDAMQSMASQMIHPKMTAREMAEMQLKSI